MNFKASVVYQNLHSALTQTKTIKQRLKDGTVRKKTVRKYTIIIMEGSSRSSKTWSIYQFLFHYMFLNRRKRVVVMRDTKEDCRDKVEPDFIKWYNDPMARDRQYREDEITWEQLNEYLNKESLSPLVNENKTKHIHTLITSKSRIEFTGADDDDRVIGLSPDVLWINEPYLFDENIFYELNQRTSDFVILDWNPRFDHWIDDLKLRDDCLVIHSTFMDNPFLPRKEKDNLLRYQPLSHKYISDVSNINLTDLLRMETIEDVKDSLNDYDFPGKKIREILRCWNNEKQKTADKYRWEVYGLGIKSEKPNKIYHGWEPVSKAFYDQIKEPVYYGLDLGITAPTACLEVKYRERCIFIDQKLYTPGRELDSLSWALEKAQVDKNRPLLCDRTVRATEHSAPLNLLDLHTAGFTYAMPAMKGKGSVFDGIEAIQKCKVYVTNTSKETWEEYYGYEFSKYNGQITDQPVKKNDHAMDALRMAFNYMVVELGITI